MVEFLIVCLSIGTSVAVDVSLITIAKFRDETLGFWSWTLPIALIHIVLTSLGLYGTLDLIKDYPAVSSYVKFAAGLLVFWLLIEWSKEWVGKKSQLGPVALTGKLLGRTGLSKFAPNLVLMLALSIDAFLGAPAFSVEASNWTNIQVVYSVFIIGLVVMGWTIGSLWFAKKLRLRPQVQVRNFVYLSLAGKFFLLSVLGFFGLMAFASGLGYETNHLAIAIASSYLAAVYFLVNFTALLSTEEKEAEERFFN